MITLLASTWWPPILQTAIGGLIGAFGAIAGGAFGSWFTWQKERQSVAAALAGEVEAFIAVTEWYQTRAIGPQSTIIHFQCLRPMLGRLAFCHRILLEMLPDSIAMPGE